MSSTPLPQPSSPSETGKVSYAPPQGIAPYWFIIVPVWLGLAALFVWHLSTRQMPAAAAFSLWGLEVYWYGILIVGGIALGAFVTSRLAQAGAGRVFRQMVPRTVRQRPLTPLDLPENVQQLLARYRVATQGELLFRLGLDHRLLGLKQEEAEQVRAALLAQPDVDPAWVNEPAWRQWNPDHVWNGIIICLILALIGARLYHVLTPSPSMAAVGIESPLDYFRNPGQLIDFRSGGLGIYGGLAGGALGLFIYTRRQRLSMLGWTDLAAVGVALGQSIGRWGNFLNQELYGRPSDLPWAIWIDPTHRLPAYADATRFHPAFLYESLWSLLTFAVLLLLARRFASKLLTGELTALYLIFYAIGRIMLETVRLDSRTVTLGSFQFDMAVATLVSLIVAVSMGVWIIVRRWRQTPAG